MTHTTYYLRHSFGVPMQDAAYDFEIGQTKRWKPDLYVA